MKISVYLTTRYGSTRFPRKALKMIGDSTVTDILIHRLKTSDLHVIMTTPTTAEDLTYMKHIADRHKIGYFAGNDNDIIQRHVDCSIYDNPDWIINVDGDDILTCPELLKKLKDIIESGIDGDCIHLQGYPLGLNLIAYKPSRLKSINYSKDTNWGSKILEAGSVIDIVGTGFKDCRLTLDYIEDMIVINHVIMALGFDATADEISQYMTKHPEVCSINSFRNKEYFQRLEDLSK